MTDGLRALPTSFATCARFVGERQSDGRYYHDLGTKLKKIASETPLLRRCSAIVSFSPVLIDSLLAAHPSAISGRHAEAVPCGDQVHRCCTPRELLFDCD